MLTLQSKSQSYQATAKWQGSEDMSLHNLPCAFAKPENRIGDISG